MKRGHHRIQAPQLRREPRVLRAVRVPAAGLDHRDARALRLREEARGHAPQCGGILARSALPHPACHAARVHGGRPQAMQLRIRFVQLLHANQQVVVRGRQRRRRIRGDLRGAAQGERHGGRERDRFLGALRQQPHEPVHPAVLQLVRRGAAAFQHVLAVEVGAVAIRRRDRMHEQRLPLRMQLAELLQRRVQREAAVHADRAGRIDRKRSAQRRIRGVRVRHNGVQAVGRATLDHEHEAAVGGRLGEQHAGRQQERAGAGEKTATTNLHRHLLRNSGETSSSASAPAGLSERAMADAVASPTLPGRTRGASARASTRSPACAAMRCANTEPIADFLLLTLNIADRRKR